VGVSKQKPKSEISRESSLSQKLEIATGLQLDIWWASSSVCGSRIYYRLLHRIWQESFLNYLFKN
jgi:hypothetical protein